MKTLSITTFLIFFTSSLSARDTTSLQTKKYADNYTWRNKTQETLDSYYLNLQPVQLTNYKLHVRIALSSQIVDLYSNDNTKFYGKLTNYIIEYINVKEKSEKFRHKKEYQYVYEKLDLNQLKLHEVVEMLFTSGQFEISTDSLLSSWSSGFLHCNSLTYQYIIDGKYTNQKFICPWGQRDSVIYKKIVLDNYQTLKMVFKLDSLYDRFEAKLPKGKTYSKDGYRMMYKLTDKQSEIWEKNQPQRDYMKSVKDTIDKILNAVLLQEKYAFDTIECTKKFYLTFGVNGKLRKVEISNRQKPKLKESLFSDYIAEKRAIKKCTREIKRILNTIDLSGLNLKTELYRTLVFIKKKEYYIKDDTKY